jgi:uncharacterized membrane protein YbaN (DUF454 family)
VLKQKVLKQNVRVWNESESESESETESEERNIGIFSSSVKLTTEFLLLAFSFFIM